MTTETNHTTKNDSRTLGWNAALIVLVTLLVYIPALRGGFVFDDHQLITDNQLVKASDGLHRFWCTTETPDYYPLTWSLWWLEWRLWGSSPTGYHVVNVLLHAANAVLVWRILRCLKIPGAGLAGLVFAVHPVNAATVAWISEQKTTLSLLFSAVAVLLYLQFDMVSRSSPTGDRRLPAAAGWYGLSWAAFLLALLSKSAVVMLPVVLLGCVWWIRGRVQWRDFLRTVPFFILSLVLGLVTIWFQYNRATEGLAQRTVGFASRLAGAGWVPWFYLSKALLPVDLTLIYPQWQINGARWISYLPGMVLVGCLALFWWKRKTWGRPLLFGLGYFVAMLFPVLGFFDQALYGVSLVADHWQYYSIVGVIALAAAGLEVIDSGLSERSQIAGMLASVVVLLLGVGTWNRSHVYADDQSLWQDNLAKDPDSWAAHAGLGHALEQDGKLPEAIGHYEQALRLKPDFAVAHYYLGLALLQTGKVPEAIGHLERTVQIKPYLAGAHNNLGVALVRAGKTQEAMEHFEQALHLKPDYAEAQKNLGLVLLQLGRAADAIGPLERYVTVTPNDPLAQGQLGAALSTMDRVPEAIRHLERALSINPDFAAAQNNLAWLLATIGPATGGDPVRAVALARQACERTGHRVPTYLDTLAAALASAGQFDEAIATVQKAIELARATAPAQGIGEMEARLQLYRAGRAYRPSAVVAPSQNP